MRKRFMAILAIIIVAVFVVAACNNDSGGTPPQGAPPTGTSQTHLTMAMSNLGVNYDPIQTNDSASSFIHTQIFSTLTRLDYDTFEPLPHLAISWDMPDPQTVHMQIRDDVFFQNGDRLTARDVQFSLERAADSAHVQAVTGPISHVTVHDDFNFTIHLEIPFMPILRHLAHGASSILPMDYMNEIGEENFPDAPIGSGPFQLTEIVLGDRLEFIRNENYFGDVPLIETATLRLVPDQPSRLIEVTSGHADIGEGIAPADIPIAEGDPGVTLMRRFNLSTNYVGFNARSPHIDNPLVRQAINYALDNQLFVDTVLLGAGAVIDGPIAPIVWGFSQQEPFGTNFDRARELLIQAGYDPDPAPGKPVAFSTTIWYNIPNAQRQQIAEMVSFALAQLNIEVEVIGIEWAQYLDGTAAGDHDMFILGWVSVTGDADYGLYPLFHSSMFGTAGNRTFWATDELDALLDQQRETVDENARLQLLDQIQGIIRNEAPWIFLNQGETLLATRSNLRGLTLNPSGSHRLDTIWFD
ncbi:MAG: ABC transporter substrate-binding protein [Defluviitaleaceae bacterium]|nr:ABC transporter substrate-binding protein [Defluviitaleaceae bacterium]